MDKSWMIWSLSSKFLSLRQSLSVKLLDSSVLNKISISYIMIFICLSEGFRQKHLAHKIFEMMNRRMIVYKISNHSNEAIIQFISLALTNTFRAWLDVVRHVHSFQTSDQIFGWTIEKFG